MTKNWPSLLILLLSTEAFAFNPKRCREGDPPKEGETILERNFLVNITGSFISSTEYISSTGNCAAIGSLEEKREVFYAYNYKFIRQEIAQGGGENLSTLLSLFNCSPKIKKNIESRLQPEYESMFEKSPAETKDKIFKSALLGCG